MVRRMSGRNHICGVADASKNTDAAHRIAKPQAAIFLEALNTKNMIA
jgi:hypothetical protein